MSNDQSIPAGDWRTTYTLLMCIALAAVVYGTLPLLIFLQGANDFGLRDFGYWMAWLYGLIGLALCFLEQAPLRYRLASIGLVWSIALLGWSSISSSRHWMNGAHSYPFDADGNMSFLTGCIATTVLLIIYDLLKSWMPTGFTMTVTWLVRCLIALWAIAPFPVLAWLMSR